MPAKSASSSRLTPYYFILSLLAIEFLDEFVYGGGEAAWPLIRTDLGLTYIQIGVLLSLPRLIGSLIEPVLGILGDFVRPDGRGIRRILILGWRGLFMTFAGLTLLLLGAAWRFPFTAGPQPSRDDRGKSIGFIAGARNVLRSLKRREVQRWLVLLEFSDLMLDVLYSYLALFFVDVVSATPVQASLAVAVWAVMGLLGDFLLIPLLERVPGLVYLRVSTVMELVLFPAFLLAPGMALKLVFLGLLGLFNAGWYAILKARLYSAMPGQSGTSIAVDNISSLVGSLIPLGLGWVAQRYNLQVTMWLLLLGPLALLVGVPRNHLKTKRV